VSAPADAPPPGPALVHALESLHPVRTRVPARTLAIAVAAALAYPVSAIARHGLRRDLGHLPLIWLIAMTLVWTLAVALLFVRALLPRRGDVLPDAARAARTTVTVCAALIAIGLGATVDAPGYTVVPPDTVTAFFAAWRHCVAFELVAVAPVFIIGAIALRHLMPTGAGRVSATLAAAGAGLAGLALLYVCPFGGALHVGFAHAGGTVVAALLATIVLRPWLKA
jgi:hypothetical protein